MKMRKKHEGNSERWLLTYSDLITLLMILFVLLYAISNVNQSKYDQLADSLSESFGTKSNSSGLNGSDSVLPGAESVLPGGGEILPEGDSESSTEQSTGQAGVDQSANQTQTGSKDQMESLNNDINKIISENNLGQDISTSHYEDGLIITFPSSVFFDSGNAILNDNMKRALDIIANKLNEIDNDILVKGYTDNVPIKDSTFSSNWQLSAVRAANVVEYLVENNKVASTRLMAVGCGENDPIASNDTMEGRNKNRRIEMVILSKANKNN
ncbi:flagellar motor protein MotB [Anaerosporobacter sp.]